jgi:hypothetical protein
LHFFVGESGKGKENGREIIKDCFNSVTSNNIKDPLTAQMPEAFYSMVRQWSPNFEWPVRSQMSQAVYSIIDQYKTNVKNNLAMYCWPRLTYFLRVKCYEFNNKLTKPQLVQSSKYPDFDNTDIVNTMKNLMLDEDWTEGNTERQVKMNILFQEVRSHCGPSFDDYYTMHKYVEKDWFESFWMWIRIQRIVYQFKSDHAIIEREWNQYDRDKVKKPTMPRLPKVKNFTIVPYADTKMKHIKFDHKDLIDLLGQLKNDENVKDKPNIRSDYRTYYDIADKKDEAWALLFDMKKINEQRTGTKEFYHRIQTDSAAVSVSFSRPKRKGAGVKLEQIREKFKKKPNEGGYKNRSAIDPGEKTHLGCVRMNVDTRNEVSLGMF